MKAIPIKINGIQFRSKLEAKWYLFMKKLKWNIEYEPLELEGINGWIPDFIIIGKNKKILVDVKPINSEEEWERHSDYEKIIEKSGFKNTDYEILILGSSLKLNFNDVNTTGFGIHHHMLKDINNNICLFVSETVFTNYNGFLPYQADWTCRISGEAGKSYIFCNDFRYDYFEKIWNECGSELQWKKNETQS
jgi:hypothetical protein